MKTSITNNRYFTPRFLGCNDPISANPVAKILSLTLTYTFLLLKSLITDLCSFWPTLYLHLLPL